MFSKQQKFAFRLDASPAVGTGHLMRSLTLANLLKESGHQSVFIARGLSANLQQHVIQHGHAIFNFPMPQTQIPRANSPYKKWLGVDAKKDAAETAAILDEQSIHHLIVDHYGIDQNWETAVRTNLPGSNLSIMVIDDLANRPHDCDILLDQSLGRKPQDYQDLVPAGTRLLLGAAYALIRHEFDQFKPQSLKRRSPARLQTILVSMGGTDEQNITGRILDHLLDIGMHEHCEIVVVLGALAPHSDSLRQKAQCAPDRISVLQGVSNMAELLSKADIAIGAGGTSAWERTFMGVPSYVLLLAENQRNNARKLQNYQAALVIDRIEDMFVKSLQPQNPATLEELARLSQNALGLGAGQKRQEVIEELTNPTTASDGVCV